MRDERESPIQIEHADVPTAVVCRAIAVMVFALVAFSLASMVMSIDAHKRHEELLAWRKYCNAHPWDNAECFHSYGPYGDKMR